MAGREAREDPRIGDKGEGRDTILDRGGQDTGKDFHKKDVETVEETK